MDLAKIIQDLLEDKARIERVIAALEDLQRNAVEIPELPNSRKKGQEAHAARRAAGGFRPDETLLGPVPVGADDGRIGWQRWRESVPELRGRDGANV